MSLTNKNEGFLLVMLTITSSVRLYSKAKMNIREVKDYNPYNTFMCPQFKGRPLMLVLIHFALGVMAAPILELLSCSKIHKTILGFK